MRPLPARSCSLPPAGVFWARHTADATVTGTRAASGANFAAWVQSVDASAFVHRRTHVTRTVFDLKDQPVEVWDARGLASATWEFTYSPTKNLFCHLEEARDADGVHFFEYDWRGLGTKASHVPGRPEQAGGGPFDHGSQAPTSPTSPPSRSMR